MSNNKLTPFQEYFLNYLRKRLDYLQKDLYDSPNHNDIKNDYNRARKELINYVDSLRKEGKEI
jgi:hypothetical protein